MSPPRSLLARRIIFTGLVINSSLLTNDSQGYLFVFLADLFLLPETFLVHGYHVSIFFDLSLSLLSINDLIKKNLVLRADLGKLFLRTMVVRTDMTLIEEIHVASIGKIYFRLLRDYLLNASKISRVVVLVVEIGV